jgi:hypothetical protein
VSRGTSIIEKVNCLGSVNLLTGRGASANFLFAGWQDNEAGILRVAVQIN